MRQFITIFTFLTVFLPTLLFGQAASDTKSELKIESDSITTSQLFKISYFINAEIDSFSKPQFKDLTTTSGPNKSTSLTIVNGKSSSSTSISYVLGTTISGKRELPSLLFYIKNKTYKVSEKKIMIYKRDKGMDSLRIKTFYSRGKEKQLKGDLEGAMLEFNNVLLLDSSHARARADYEEAATKFYGKKDSKVFDDPSGGIALQYLYSGNTKFDLKDYQGSINDYDKSIDLDTSNAEAYYCRGNAKAKLHLYQEAIQDLSLAIALNPKHTNAYFNRACSKMLLKQEDGAIKDFSSLINIDSTYANAYWGRGDIYLRQGKYDKALKDIIVMNKLMPNNPKSLYALGSVYSNLKQYEEAITQYTNAIKLNPRFGDAFKDRASAFEKNRQYKKALEDFTSAIYYSKGDNVKLGELYSSRGYCYSVMDNFKKAFSDLDSALILNPDNGNLYWNRGSAYAMNGQYEKSLTDFNSALKYYKTDSISSARLLENIGMTKKTQNKYEEAISYFDKAISLYPNYGDAYHQRGLTKQILNDLTGAEADLAKAVAVQPNCPCNKSEYYLDILKALLIKVTDNKYTIKVYPTVFNYSFNVDISNENESIVKNISLFIFNMNGQVVKKIENITSEHIEVTADNLSPGMYLYEIISGDTKIGSGKVVLQ